MFFSVSSLINIFFSNLENLRVPATRSSPNWGSNSLILPKENDVCQLFVLNKYFRLINKGTGKLTQTARWIISVRWLTNLHGKRLAIWVAQCSELGWIFHGIDLTISWNNYLKTKLVHINSLSILWINFSLILFNSLDNIL